MGRCGPVDKRRIPPLTSAWVESGPSAKGRKRTSLLVPKTPRIEPLDNAVKTPRNRKRSRQNDAQSNPHTAVVACAGRLSPFAASAADHPRPEDNEKQRHAEQGSNEAPPVSSWLKSLSHRATCFIGGHCPQWVETGHQVSGPRPRSVESFGPLQTHSWHSLH